MRTWGVSARFLLLSSSDEAYPFIGNPMKTRNRTCIALICLLCLTIWPTTVSAQSSDMVLNQIKSSILAADARGLSEQTVYSVEIGLFGAGRYYSQAQATLLLKEFFKEYPPKDFRVTGSTKTPGAWFIEGQYDSTASDSPLRMYIRLRVTEGTWKVREFLVEELNG